MRGESQAADPILQAEAKIRPFAESYFNALGVDPAMNHERKEFLLKWAIEDCGAKAPQDFLDLLGKLDTASRGMRGPTIERLYHQAFRSQQMSRWQNPLTRRT